MCLYIWRPSIVKCSMFFLPHLPSNKSFNLPILHPTFSSDQSFPLSKPRAAFIHSLIISHSIAVATSFSTLPSSMLFSRWLSFVSCLFVFLLICCLLLRKVNLYCYSYLVRTVNYLCYYWITKIGWVDLHQIPEICLEWWNLGSL